MAKCVIFCAADFDGLACPIADDDYVIAADGGLNHVGQLGITPDAIIGDFDSLGFVPQSSTVFPVEKDDTDSMLAIRRGLALGYREFLLYGSLGGTRLDHSMANLQALHFLCEHGAWGYLVGSNCLVTALSGGVLRFPAGCRGNLSVFCVGADAQGVDLEGLYYPLKDGSLTAAFPLGVSNHFTGDPASIRVREGTLLVIWDRCAGFPER